MTPAGEWRDDPGAPSPGTPVCAAADLPEGAARGFVFGEGGERFELLLARGAGGVFGYVNQCPHQFTPLDIWPDRLLSADGRELVCATHGARFRVEDGQCVSGPCVGKALRRVPIARRGEIFVIGGD